MRRGNGWTLVEMLFCIGIIAMLTVLVIPALGGARDLARLASCGSSLHNLHTALMSYAASNQAALPPFAFSSYTGDLPLSGQWGGMSQNTDPTSRGRVGVQCVNLWTLLSEARISPDNLICPSADVELKTGQTSLFPFSNRYSSYCMRFPPSEDLFRGSPNLAYRNRRLLEVYTAAGGGTRVRVGNSYQTVPLVHVDGNYRIAGSAAPGGKIYSVANDAMLSDGFWRQGLSSPAPSVKGAQSYPVGAKWDHGRQFNVAYGCGAVRTVQADETVRANTLPVGETLSDDGQYFATYAERVWQYFDAQ